MIVVLGITVDGETVLGLCEGADENVCGRGMTRRSWAGRGLDSSVPRADALDGGKASAAVVRGHAGEAGLHRALSDRRHKRRNAGLTTRRGT